MFRPHRYIFSEIERAVDRGARAANIVIAGMHINILDLTVASCDGDMLAMGICLLRAGSRRRAKEGR